MSESNWRFDGADNEPEGDGALNEEPTRPGPPQPESGQPESASDGTHPADREWLEKLDQLLGPIGPQGFFLDEDEVDDEDEDDLWDDSPLPHHSNRVWRHPSEMGKDPAQLEPDPVGEPADAPFGVNHVGGEEAAAASPLGAYVNDRFDARPASEANPLALRLMVAAGVSFIALGTILSLIGVVDARSQRVQTSSVGIAEGSGSGPESVVINFRTTRVRPVGSFASSATPNQGAGPAGAVLPGAVLTASPSIEASTTGIVIDREGTVAAVFESRPSATVQIRAQMWSDDASLIGWDPTSGVATFNLHARSNFPVPSAATSNAAPSPDASGSQPTQTTIIHDMVLVRCPESPSVLTGAPIIAGDGELIGLVLPKDTVSDGEDGRYAIPFGELLELSGRIRSEQSEYQGG